MVYMGGSKMARNAASITNRPTCGGNKKAGLAPSTGWSLSNNSSLIRAPTRVPVVCVPNTTPQTQRIGYQATLGP